MPSRVLINCLYASGSDDKSEILSKAFLVLEDWAHGLTFDSVEIDKERGVVGEEWRLEEALR